MSGIFKNLLTVTALPTKTVLTASDMAFSHNTTSFQFHICTSSNTALKNLKHITLSAEKYLTSTGKRNNKNCEAKHKMQVMNGTWENWYHERRMYSSDRKGDACCLFLFSFLKICCKKIIQVIMIYISNEVRPEGVH